MIVKRDQKQIAKVKEDIDRLTRMISNPNRSASSAEVLDERRQKYHVALKILSKEKK